MHRTSANRALGRQPCRLLPCRDRERRFGLVRRAHPISRLEAPHRDAGHAYVLLAVVSDSVVPGGRGPLHRRRRVRGSMCGTWLCDAETALWWRQRRRSPVPDGVRQRRGRAGQVGSGCSAPGCRVGRSSEFGEDVAHVADGLSGAAQGAGDLGSTGAWGVVDGDLGDAPALVDGP